MRVTVLGAGQPVHKDMPEAPLVGDEIRISVQGSGEQTLTVRTRRWVWRPGTAVEVELDCA